MAIDEPKPARERRIDGLKRNVDWLEETDLDDVDSFEIAKRLGLIKGDAEALIQLISENDE